MTILRDSTPEVTKITAVVEFADGQRFRWDVDNHRPLTSLRAKHRVVARHFGLDQYAPLGDEVFHPARSVEITFSTNDEARLTTIPRDEVLVDPAAGDAIQSVVLAWERFTSAEGMVEVAEATVALNNCMADLSTWVPEVEEEGS